MLRLWTWKSSFITPGILNGFFIRIAATTSDFTACITRTFAVGHLSFVTSVTVLSCSPINGEVVTLIPNQVILFEDPDDDAVRAAGERDFVDANGRRYFSTAFYADLLAHLGAKLVVCFDDAPPATVAADARRATYSAAGLGCCALEDLCSGGAGRFSLQSHDRFIALVTGCPGPVAVQCRGALASSTACAHLTALILRLHRFPASAHAVAWMQMAHPGRLAEPIDLAQLERHLSQQASPKAWRNRRFCQPARRR